jgi:hypothetical protein
MKIDRKGTGFMFVSDEDLWLAGMNPLFVTNNEFKQIVDGLTNHYDEDFASVLADIIREVKGDY